MIICCLVGIWRTLRTGQKWSGHTYIEKEVHKNKYVQVLECEDCGHISISWSDFPYPDQKE